MRLVLAYILGCVTGGLLIAALLLWLLSGGEEPPPQAVVLAPPAPPCPALVEEHPPWSPDADEDSRAQGLPVPAGLQARVGFWKTLWGKVPARVYVLVDRRRPWVGYGRVDCRALFATGDATAERRCDRRLIEAKRRIVRRLRRGRRRPGKKLRALFAGDRRLARSAYRNVIVLQGMRGRLDKARAGAASFLSEAQRIFAAEGLPPELARVTIIESLANPTVESHAGAVGAYQFVAGTARSYLRVDTRVDERRDPLRSAWAAARYLKSLHKRFGRWPLVMTAYNTGPTRLRRLLKRRRHRSLTELVAAGHRGQFGFDGQNYFAQLAAVIQLTAGWPETAPVPSPSYRRVGEDVTLESLASCTGVAVESLRKINPALTSVVVDDGARVPKGYVLALPPSASSDDV